MDSRTRRRTAAVLTVGAVLATSVVLGAAAASAQTGSAQTGSAQTAIAQTASATRKGPGCAANRTAIPAGAWTRTIPDVDGDGRRDVEFITRRGQYGIRTASGATRIQQDDLHAPGAHEGRIVHLDGGHEIAILDDGREAQIFTFTAACRFATIRGAQGAPYTFALAGYGARPVRGTGVACTSGRLFGVLARLGAHDRFTIERTRVLISSDGRHATNGAGTRSSSTHARTSRATRQALVVDCSEPAVATDGR